MTDLPRLVFLRKSWKLKVRDHETRIGATLKQQIGGRERVGSYKGILVMRDWLILFP